MSATNDSQLLADWVHGGKEEAFTELVQRHLPLVWGTARRITGDSDLARDVAQSVFADLAGKARVLPGDVFLPGWLHRAASYGAHKVVRGAVRRTARESQVMHESESEPTATATEAEAAATLQPLLDEALASLPDADRDALLLRYFSGQSFGTIGATVGASDDTVQKRVSRALDKLREHFRARGVVVGAGAVAASISLAASCPVPAGLAGGISAALVGTGAASSISSWISMKILTSGLAVATGLLAVVAFNQNHKVDALTATNHALQKKLSAASEARQTAAANTSAQLSPDLLNELLRLRAESSQRQRESPRAQVGKVAKLEATVAEQSAKLAAHEAEARFEAQIVNRVNALKHLGLAARVYASDNQEHLPPTFDAMRTEMGLDANGRWPGGVSPDEFEFFPQPRAISEREPQLILFREKQPLTKPDGSEIRVYALADGSVQRVSGDRIAEFERDGTATGEPPAEPTEVAPAP